jgi:peptide/nickel transport system permease protein
MTAIAARPEKRSNARRRAAAGWRGLRHNRRLAWGLGIVLTWAILALLAPIIAPYGPTTPHPSDVSQAPSWHHLMGTDADGFDIFSRVLWAPRVDLGIAVVSTLMSVVIGVPLGALAGFFGGRGGIRAVGASIVMRAVDVSLAFPVFVFALALVAVLGESQINVILALTLVNSPVFVRLTRSQVLGVRERTFVEAARCSGNSELRITFRHVLPNAIGAPLTQLSVVLGFAILLTAGLSFVGAGVPVPTPEWGIMISEGSEQMITGQWWAAVFPGLALASAVLGFGLLGEGLRVYLDPRSSGGGSASTAAIGTSDAVTTLGIADAGEVMGV